MICSVKAGGQVSSFPREVYRRQGSQQSLLTLLQATFGATRRSSFDPQSISESNEYKCSMECWMREISTVWNILLKWSLIFSGSHYQEEGTWLCLSLCSWDKHVYGVNGYDWISMNFWLVGWSHWNNHCWMASALHVQFVKILLKLPGNFVSGIACFGQENNYIWERPALTRAKTHHQVRNKGVLDITLTEHRKSSCMDDIRLQRGRTSLHFSCC